MAVEMLHRLLEGKGLPPGRGSGGVGNPPVTIFKDVRKEKKSKWESCCMLSSLVFYCREDNGLAIFFGITLHKNSLNIIANLLASIEKMMCNVVSHCFHQISNTYRILYFFLLLGARVAD